MMPEGARERVRTGLAALVLLLSLLAVTLLVERFFHGAAPVLFHVALVLPAGLGLFALGLVRREDLDKLADVQLERPWTRVVRDSLLAHARLLRPPGRRAEDGVSGLRVLVIIPAHDEQESLPRTLDELRAVVPGADLLVVDDGSRAITGSGNRFFISPPGSLFRGRS